MQPTINNPLDAVTRGQMALALAWEREMNKAFKGIYPKNERRKRMARRAGK